MKPLFKDALTVVNAGLAGFGELLEDARIR